MYLESRTNATLENKRAGATRNSKLTIRQMIYLLEADGY